MIDYDFNGAHPTHADRNRGWEPIPPRENRGEMGVQKTVRHIFILAEQLFYDIDATTGLVARSLRNTQGAPDIATQEADSIGRCSSDGSTSTFARLNILCSPMSCAPNDIGETMHYGNGKNRTSRFLCPTIGMTPCSNRSPHHYTTISYAAHSMSTSPFHSLLPTQGL